MLAVLVALATGCGGRDAVSTTAVTTTATRQPPAGAAEALHRLAAVARTGDVAAVRRMLTPSTRPSVAGELVDGLGSFPAKTKVFLAEQIDPAWAVAALAGPRRVEGAREYGSFAVALRLVRGSWKAEIGPAVSVRPLGPTPGSVKGRAPTQVAAEFSARAKIVQGGLWLDGSAIAGTTSGTARRFTAYGASPILTPGPHVVVAFAEAGGHATAVAWSFRVR